MPLIMMPTIQRQEMKKELFAELMESMGEAHQHARGKRELRTTELPNAPASISAGEIRRMRDALNSSQAVFARFLNVSTQLVQAWEANRRRPYGAALRLLDVGLRYPDIVFTLAERKVGAVREGRRAEGGKAADRRVRARVARAK